MDLLVAQGISKRFGGVVALDRMHFAGTAGEVHAILGENGAGKSTLIRILSGAIPADAGTISLRGSPYQPRTPSDARRAAITTVFQELALVPDLTVAENIWFGAEPLTPAATISRRGIERRTRELLAGLGLPALPADRPVRLLSIADQQLVEIAKALCRDPDILILDEATSALAPRHVDWLLGIARRYAAEGRLVLYISHRMDEVRRVADRVTVLRNGETVGTVVTAQVTDDDIVSMMLGRRLGRLFPERRPSATERVALRTQGLSVGHLLRDVDLELHEGEVLGVAGIQGHGQRELFMALFGAVRSRGRIEVWGTPTVIRSPGHALSPDVGIALLPEDRRTQGLLLGKSVRENLVLAALSRIVRHGFVDARAEDALVSRYSERLRIVAASAAQPAGTLSGGNQQKVVLAKLLATEARILLLYDPTRGVDVGTKAEIFAEMRDLAAQGYGILFYSTDLAELANVADRTLVLSYGRVATVLAGRDLTEDRILHATMAGQDTREARAAS
jgi:ribose transport system ATP-binding protein